MKFRPATMDDAEILLAWRNDPHTVAMSKSQSTVHWDVHVHWLWSRIHDYNDKNQLYIVEQSGVPIGTYNVMRGLLSYTIAPEFRKLGYGEELLKRIKELHGRLICEIREDNVASIKVARRANHIVILLEP